MILYTIRCPLPDKHIPVMVAVDTSMSIVVFFQPSFVSVTINIFFKPLKATTDPSSDIPPWQYPLGCDP